jgi:hypothetical protein
MQQEKTRVQSCTQHHKHPSTSHQHLCVVGPPRGARWGGGGKEAQML